MSFFSADELRDLGLAQYGVNVLISKKASIYGAQHISIGNHVRIDDFCILSGHIELGSYIHIAAYTALYGGDAGIRIDDYANLSSRICLYALSDDYSGETMTNPMVPAEYKAVTQAPINIEKHCILGSGCIVLPGVTISEGASFGALSLIRESCMGWSIYAGIPCRKIRDRSKNLLRFEAMMKEQQAKDV